MVQSKRRHCDNLRSADVIECVGGLVPSNWKVDLRQPDVVVWVEICTNLAGLSIVPSSSLREAFQFNLLQARTASVASE
jgi:tRNA(Ser,Leu) C12 N-acetylase TAN1